VPCRATDVDQGSVIKTEFNQHTVVTLLVFKEVSECASRDEVMSICSCPRARVGRRLEATQKIGYADALLAKAAS